MPRRSRPRRAARRRSEERRRPVPEPAWLVWYGGVAFVLIGLLGVVLAVGSVLKSVRYAEHLRWLRAHGTAVQATVIDVDPTGRGGNDDLRVRFDHEGRRVEAEVDCPWRDCPGWRGHSIKLWINPADPEDLVEDHRDTSTRNVVGHTFVPVLTGLGFATAGWAPFGAALYLRVARWRRRRSAAGATTAGATRAARAEPVPPR